MQKHLLQQLIQKGVVIHLPETVYISEDVLLDRISGEQVTLYPGTRISGEKTLIMRGCRIGKEGPVTLDNCLIGENCTLDGGYFQQCVLAGQNTFGSGAHVRKGTILEEQAGAAHTVGLKQTILFPFVTLGSLINFCDCLMAGGTSRKNHSEVGSSFVHFNYTPNQDKATASMIGNVHQGVMLDQPAIFLGGQGGIVGPCRIGFGCITAAGSVIRKDEILPNRIIFGGAFKEMTLHRNPGIYSNPKRIYDNNIYYLAALFSLKAWYRYVRAMFSDDFFSRALVQGMQETLEICIQERIDRIFDFSEKLKQSREQLSIKSKYKKSSAINEHDLVLENIKKISGFLNDPDPIDFHDIPPPDKFIADILQVMDTCGKDYITVIQNLSQDMKKQGSKWLNSIEQRFFRQTLIPTTGK